MSRDSSSRFTTSAENGGPILEKPLGTIRRLRIITIGAGASGINMIQTLRKNLTNYEHVVYEKNPKVGGTWYENRYPGCMCDIPAHNYQFSWKPNPTWSSFFAPALEIEKYLCRICEEEGLRKWIQLGKRVVEARWNESGVWELKVEDLETGRVFEDYCHFLLDASGILK
jgi:cation diffusion facilitator CzcD-associated flavoprotein CzcO